MLKIHRLPLRGTCVVCAPVQVSKLAQVSKIGTNYEYFTKLVNVILALARDFFRDHVVYVLRDMRLRVDVLCL